jgi:hypothetical protein
MTDVTRVTVLCASCGRRLCRVMDTPSGVAYRLDVGSRGAPLHSHPDAVFCPEHGWPDLNTPSLVRQLDKARTTDTVTTHRAPCGIGVPPAM